jgi:hypothetical protein
LIPVAYIHIWACGFLGVGLCTFGFLGYSGFYVLGIDEVKDILKMRLRIDFEGVLLCYPTLYLPKGF